MTVSKSSSVIFHSTVSRSTPALVTRMSSRPKCVDRRADERLGGLGRADGRDHRDGAAAAPRSPRPRLGRGSRVHVVDHDGGALPRQLLGVGEAEAAPGPGDDGDFAVQ